MESNHRSHDTILIRQSNENRTSFDFDSTFRFDFRLSTFAFTRYDFSRKRVEWKSRMENRMKNRIV